MGWCLGSSRLPSSCRLLQVRTASRSCTRPDTTISACCARNCTGVAAARTSRGENPDSTMLTHLQIRDLAIVDAVELDFMPGLTVLTGETGAGKSIIVDALTLISGARAAADQIRAGAERAEVAATFDIR